MSAAQGHGEAALCVKRLERKKNLIRIGWLAGAAIALAFIFGAIRGCHVDTQDPTTVSQVSPVAETTQDSTDIPVTASQQPPLLEYPESNDNTIHDVVDQMPRYPGGDQKLKDYIKSHINYPERAAEYGIKGTVVCQVVVEKDGSLSDVRVIRSADSELDREAVRVIKTMDKWQPGIQDRERVRVRYTIPVKFELP